MQIVQSDIFCVDTPSKVQLPKAQRSLHRLGIVRRLQEISCRTLAQRLNTEVVRIKWQERPTSDIRLSKLYEWQRVLEVPIAELLVENDNELATPLLRRAQLVRLMKTALAIQEATAEEPARRMAQRMVDQLTEVMPELKTVSSWHMVGTRRRRDEYGVAIDRRLSEDVFLDLID